MMAINYDVEYPKLQRTCIELQKRIDSLEKQLKKYKAQAYRVRKWTKPKKIARASHE